MNVGYQNLSEPPYKGSIYNLSPPRFETDAESLISES